MKSIKEKAKEHAPYTENDSWQKSQRCIIAQIYFEYGANYVLDEIEKLLDEFTNFEDSLIVRRAIEQLKK